MHTRDVEVRPRPEGVRSFLGNSEGVSAKFTNSWKRLVRLPVTRTGTN